MEIVSLTKLIQEAGLRESSKMSCDTARAVEETKDAISEVPGASKAASGLYKRGCGGIDATTG